MNKDEMIKEIQRTIIECCNYIDENKGLRGNKCGSCEFWDDTNNECASYEKKQATALYNANCRIIADDEIVIKKSEYEELQDCDESNRLKKQLEQAKQETAREILQIIKDEYEYIGNLERIICNKYGIELERNL